jgi:hypothetical protein
MNNQLSPSQLGINNLAFNCVVAFNKWRSHRPIALRGTKPLEQTHICINTVSLILVKQKIGTNECARQRVSEKGSNRPRRSQRSNNRLYNVKGKLDHYSANTGSTVSQSVVGVLTFLMLHSFTTRLSISARLNFKLIHTLGSSGPAAAAACVRTDYDYECSQPHAPNGTHTRTAAPSPSAGAPRDCS